MDESHQYLKTKLSFNFGHTHIGRNITSDDQTRSHFVKSGLKQRGNKQHKYSGFFYTFISKNSHFPAHLATQNECKTK